MKDIDDFTISRLLKMFKGSVEEVTNKEKEQFDVDNLKKEKIMVYANFIGTDASG